MPTSVSTRCLEESVVLPGARIGANCTLRRVIVDGGVSIPDGTVLDAPSGAGCTVRLVTNESVAETVVSHAVHRHYGESSTPRRMHG